MVACGGVEVSDHSFLTSALEGGVRSSPPPSRRRRRLKLPPVTVNRRMDGPVIWFGRLGEDLLNRPGVVSRLLGCPVPSLQEIKGKHYVLQRNIAVVSAC